MRLFRNSLLFAAVFAQFPLPDGRMVTCKNQQINGSDMGAVERFYQALESKPPVTVLYDPRAPTNCAIKEMAEMAAGLERLPVKGFMYKAVAFATLFMFFVPSLVIPPGFGTPAGSVISVLAGIINVALITLLTLLALTCCKTFVRKNFVSVLAFWPIFWGFALLFWPALFYGLIAKKDLFERFFPWEDYMRLFMNLVPNIGSKHGGGQSVSISSTNGHSVHPE